MRSSEFKVSFLTGLSVLQEVNEVTSNEKSSRRTCPNTQTKQKPKFVLLFFKEWEIQCECVGKPMNHCCVAKTTEKRQRDNNELWKANYGLSQITELTNNIFWLIRNTMLF